MGRFARTLRFAAKTAVMASAIVLTASCASIAEPRPSATAAASDSTEARAERIFRYQSRIADALLDRYPLSEDFATADPTLIVAEGQMTERCSTLTRAVLENFEGEAPSLTLKLEVIRSLDDCERAAARVEHMIAAHDQSLIATGGP